MHTHAYDRAHDAAQRLNRRHERDLHWAKERRRQQEREIAEATELLATSRFALVGTAIVVDVVLLAAIGAGLWAAAAAASNAARTVPPSATVVPAMSSAARGIWLSDKGFSFEKMVSGVYRLIRSAVCSPMAGPSVIPRPPGPVTAQIPGEVSCR